MDGDATEIFATSRSRGFYELTMCVLTEDIPRRGARVG